jgi:hypothetical protein
LESSRKRERFSKKVPEKGKGSRQKVPKRERFLKKVPEKVKKFLRSEKVPEK